MSAEKYQGVPVHKSPPPIVHVQGTHRQMGQQIGEACQSQIRHSIENARVLLESAYEELALDWNGAIIQSRKYIPFAEERYPQYVDELMGMAEGAGVDYEELSVVNAMEAVTSDALHLTRCTSIAVNDERTADGHVLIAHNEDWIPEDEDDVYIVHAKPDKEPPYLAMTYGGLLPNIGFNAYGLAQLCDSVHPTDSRIGMPRVLVSRGVLAATTPAGAIRRTIVPQRAAGYNHMLVHESGELYCVEVSALRFNLLYGLEGFLVHTNHYLSDSMKKVEKPLDERVGSVVRYFRASRLVQQTELHSMRTLQNIQRDHVNFTDSICNHSLHESEPLDREKTINALIVDLTTREMHIAWGNPCQNKYHTYHLNA